MLFRRDWIKIGIILASIVLSFKLITTSEYGYCTDQQTGIDDLYEIRVLASSHGDKFWGIKVREGYVVWMDRNVPYDFNVFDGNHTSQIMDIEDFVRYIEIINGRLFYATGDYENGHECFVYDLEKGTTTRLTFNEYYETNIQYDEDYIVFQAEIDNTLADNGQEIFLYKISEGKYIQITNDSYYDQRPHVSGDIVAWTSEREHGSEVFYYRISTGKTVRLTDNEVDNFVYDVEDNVILFDEAVILSTRPVYHEVDFLAVYEVDNDEFYFISDENSSGWNYHPKIYGNYVAWAGSDSVTSRGEIYVYYILKHETHRITNNDQGDVHPYIYGDTLVWQGWSGGKEIFLYDLKTETKRQLTYNMSARVPWIDEDMIVWESWDGENMNLVVALSKQKQETETDQLSQDLGQGTIDETSLVLGYQGLVLILGIGIWIISRKYHSHISGPTTINYKPWRLGFNPVQPHSALKRLTFNALY